MFSVNIKKRKDPRLPKKRSKRKSSLRFKQNHLQKNQKVRIKKRKKESSKGLKKKTKKKALVTRQSACMEHSPLDRHLNWVVIKRALSLESPTLCRPLRLRWLWVCLACDYWTPRRPYEFRISGSSSRWP